MKSKISEADLLRQNLLFPERPNKINTEVIDDVLGFIFVTKNGALIIASLKDADLPIFNCTNRDLNKK